MSSITKLIPSVSCRSFWICAQQNKVVWCAPVSGIYFITMQYASVSMHGIWIHLTFWRRRISIKKCFLKIKKLFGAPKQKYVAKGSGTNSVCMDNFRGTKYWRKFFWYILMENKSKRNPNSLQMCNEFSYFPYSHVTSTGHKHRILPTL